MVNSSIRNTITILICLVASFCNYCLLLMGCRFILPITILPIASLLIFKYKIPAIMIILFGLFDDIMLNFRVGTCAVIYSIISYLISINWKKQYNPMHLIYIFVMLYVVINFVCFVVLI
jgi:hypothetical protein